MIDKLWKEDSRKLNEIIFKTNLQLNAELAEWKHIVDHMHYPFDEKRQVYLQQQGFLDKELLTVADIAGQRPINQRWSWDRILRSCFIKQADV